MKVFNIANLQEALKKIEMMVPAKRAVTVYVSPTVWEQVIQSRPIDVLLTWPTGGKLDVVLNEHLEAGSYMIEYSDGTTELHLKGGKQ